MIKINMYLMLCGIIGLVVSFGCSDDDGENRNKTALVAPTLNNATDISANSFTVTWEAVDGANGYLIDVATDQRFGQMVEPYNSWRQNAISLKVENLDPSTDYYVRVRAMMGMEVSGNSNVISLTTLEEVDTEPEEPLKSAATTFSVGVALSADRISSGSHAKLYEREFNQVTAEWEMKMNITYPRPGEFDFSKADKIVDYAIANDMGIHGHALIWHNAVPSWVESFSGTNEEFEAMIKDYITTVVTRYKGKVKSWDVVNEAFEDNSGELRNSVFRRKMGDDYIAKCHQWVRDADPEVKIFYNDYSMTFDKKKQQSTFNMADDFKSRGVPLDGLGFQMHISYNWPNTNDIEAAVQKVIDRGLLLHFSELDVRVNPDNGISSLTPQRAIEQQKKVEEVVRIYNAIPQANKFALTVWGLKDDESWILYFWDNPDWPLLFNADFSPKEAHTGFLQGLKD